MPILYYPERKPYGIWNITDFIPPDEAFFLRVTGYDRDGFLFQRVSSVLFSNIIPGQSNILPSHAHSHVVVHPGPGRLNS